MAASLPTDRVPFPHEVDEFNDDDRISYSQLDNCWILEDDDGSQWEFNEALKKWMPMLDEELRKQQSAAYAVADVDEAEPVQPPKKRKQENMQAELSSKKSRKGSNDQQQHQRKNTSVYVTNIPRDATYDEVVDLFSRYGILAESLDTGEKRVKLYTDENGNFKGEALVIYFREESVPLAIQMLDDSDFRLGRQDPSGRIKVSKADFSHKATHQQDNNAHKSRTEKDKLKGRHKYMKMSSKLADWDDDDPSAVESTTNRWDKVVILKHMFTLDELEEDPTLLIDIPQDIREECQKYGVVTNVVIYDKEADGVVTVRFSTPEAAQACVRATNGRNFGGQVVEAYISEGRERFKRSDHKGPKTDEEEREEEERLEKFGEWLEKEDSKRDVARES